MDSWVECSPMVLETEVQSQFESYQRLKKWHPMPPCLTLSIIRYGSRVKWSNPRKRPASELSGNVNFFFQNKLMKLSYIET